MTYAYIMYLINVFNFKRKEITELICNNSFCLCLARFIE